WDDTHLVWPAEEAAALSRPACFRDAVSGRDHDTAGATLALVEVLRDFPVALLEGDAGPAGRQDG
ncbi:MAG: hypothetical protein ABIN96_10880, partial [Rubrivivax sp.]